ncbi:MAG TPA: hypothetical protein VD963_04925 [Phycisphaerales bacterium]|nr:hypothetical protein [Phycisphaerales bacterium]
MRQHWRWLSVLAVLGCGLALALWRAGIFRDRSAEASEAAAAEAQAHEAVRHGQEAYRALRTVRIAELGSVERVRDTLEEATVGSGSRDPGALRADRDALLQHAAEFLHHRFGQGSVAVYRQWRTGRGYAFLSPGDPDFADAAIPLHYKLFTGKVYPGDERLDEVHDELWETSLTRRDNGWLVVELAAEPAGLTVVFGEIAAESPGTWPALKGHLDVKTWHGVHGGGHRSWWIPPGGACHAQLARHRSLRVACVGAVVGFERGDRYPLRLMFFQTPGDGRWWLEAVQTLNAPEERFKILEF